jgi:hypothetical protein
MMILQRQPELLHIAAALHPPGRFAGRLHRWQQQSHEHANNRYDDK